MPPAAGHRVAVVTDSTASVPAALLDAADITVVPLQVVIDGVPHREGVDLCPSALADAMRAGATVSTSQPGPDAFARVYARLAARGAREIVSVHLSSELSGTVTSAQIAAQTCGVPVHVVDSRTVGMGLGFAVLAAARAGAQTDASGGSGDAAARAALRCAASSEVLFAVDTLDHLRRGGRLGPVAAAVGAVLGLRPVLGVRDGRIEVVEKVRTSVRARERVIDASVEAVRRRSTAVAAVHHFDDPALGEEVARVIRDRCGAGLDDVHVAQISAVVGAHVGPGLVAVVVAER